MKSLFTLLVLANFLLVYPQNLDSIYYQYVKLKTGESVSTQADVLKISEQNEKCGFALSALVNKNFKNFTSEQQLSLAVLRSRPTKETSVVSPSGYFRVHYNSTGYDAPQYDLNEFLIALDSVYNFEVNILGYPPPPTDDQNGGDNLYDVYISSLASRAYGSTEFEDELSGNRYTSFMIDDNDFAGLYTEGIDGARVTAAHEFFHAIQIGNYREPVLDRGSNLSAVDDTYYYELSSVAMEEFVFDDINDYYENIGNYMTRTSKTMSKISGYYLGILNIFFKDRFGYDVIKRTWELMITEPSLVACNEALVEYGSNLRNEFNEFGIWTFFTGKRAKPGYFEEADYYPMLTPGTIMNFSAPSSGMLVSSAPVSNYFIRFDSQMDTIYVLVSNSDIENGVNAVSTLSQFDYTIYNSNVDGSRKIDEDYYGLLTSSYLDVLSSAVFFNNELVGSENIEKVNEPYPLPFRYSCHDFIKIPTNANTGDEAYLNIYSSGLDLVYDGIRVITGVSGGIVQWNGRNNSGEKLSTGVYVYAVKYGDTVEKGKLVIFND